MTRIPETFWVFLRLGLTSFGGPVAHLGYFREAFVARRQWLSDAAYAELIALCQFLPGPASSQVGMAVGLHRAGLGGMAAAWVGFTLPSALVMAAAGVGIVSLGSDLPDGLLQGLKIAALAVVAQAAWQMGRSLAPDVPRATFAVIAAIILLMVPVIWIAVAVIAIAGVAGVLVLRAPEADAGSGLSINVPRGLATVSLILFFALLIGLPLWAATGGNLAGLVDTFYRAGSLVFGGGHVVLPLLETETVPVLTDRQTFMAGYGAAQAVPGPLFTFGAYLGGAAGGWTGALIATLAIFLPSFLLVLGVLPIWSRVRENQRLRNALMGVNAAVVGLVIAALYDPVFASAVRGPADLALGLVAFAALMFWRVPSWGVVLLCAGLGVVSASL